MASKPVVTARLRRALPVLVCQKCLGRIDDGKALRAIVVVSAATLRSGEYLLLSGADASTEAVTALLPDQVP